MGAADTHSRTPLGGVVGWRRLKAGKAGTTDSVWDWEKEIRLAVVRFQGQGKCKLKYRIQLLLFAAIVSHHIEGPHINKKIFGWLFLEYVH
jgi:hypothetical protein